jgi:hypothetical protein
MSRVRLVRGTVKKFFERVQKNRVADNVMLIVPEPAKQVAAKSLGRKLQDQNENKHVSPRARSLFFNFYLGLAPQALCCRPLRGLRPWVFRLSVCYCGLSRNPRRKEN